MKRASGLKLRFLGLGGTFAILAVTGAGFWFVVTHRNAVAVSSQAGEIEFFQMRARFANQRPLLDMRRRKVTEMSGSSQGVAPLRSFHTVVFDTRGGQRIVRITVPYWFACRFAGRDRVFRWRRWNTTVATVAISQYTINDPQRQGEHDTAKQCAEQADDDECCDNRVPLIWVWRHVSNILDPAFREQQL